MEIKHALQFCNLLKLMLTILDGCEQVWSNAEKILWKLNKAYVFVIWGSPILGKTFDNIDGNKLIL